MKSKLIRVTTIPDSLNILLEGQLNYISQYFDVIAVSSNQHDLELYGKKEGVRTYSVNMTRKITPFKDLIALWKMYHFFKIEKPFIVHTHTPKAGLIGMLAAYFANVPHRLHTVAGLPLLETTFIKRWVLEKIEKLTYSCATKIFPNSHGLKNIILKHNFCNIKKLYVIANGSSNGIDTDYFNLELFLPNKSELRNNIGINIDDFVFIFVGRLVTDKGINELVLAFTELCKVKSKIKLLLLGNYETEFDKLTPKTLHTINTHKQIFAIGFQKDVRPFFAISDALVFPSYREGFPNVILQALSMELPSIVTDINGCNELVQHEYNGLIIPPKSSKDLFDSMNRLSSDLILLQNLKNKTRASVISLYQRKKVWQEILNIYHEL